MPETQTIATARCGGCGLPLIMFQVREGWNTDASANPHVCNGQLVPPFVLEVRVAETPAPEEQWECCADAGIDCPSCLTGRHAECPDCAQYGPPDDDYDDWPDEDE